MGLALVIFILESLLGSGASIFGNDEMSNVGYINGKKIGDQVLAPNPTDYRKSFFYNTHDVTAEIKNGSNAIATVLGNGRFFTMRQNYKTHKHNNFGFPKLLLQLEIEYSNGQKEIVTSDESWKLNLDGPVRTNNEYDGEE